MYLTYRYRGWRQLLYRTVVFPLRSTPLGRLAAFADERNRRTAQAIRWYRQHGRPVTVVIPSYRDPELVATLVAAIRRTTPSSMVRIVVADDGGGPEHVAALRRLDGVEVLVGERNAGFSATVNRGLRAARHSGNDVVLLNSDVVPMPGLAGGAATCGDATSGNRDRGREAAVSDEPDPVRRDDPQSHRARLV